jgi:hypothetical protein
MYTFHGSPLVDEEQLEYAQYSEELGLLLPLRTLYNNQRVGELQSWHPLYSGQIFCT